MTEGNSVVTVKSARGVIRARQAVVATNSSISDRFAIHTKTAPYRTYVITLRDQARRPTRRALLGY